MENRIFFTSHGQRFGTGVGLFSALKIRARRAAAAPPWEGGPRKDPLQHIHLPGGAGCDGALCGWAVHVSCDAAAIRPPQQAYGFGTVDSDAVPDVAVPVLRPIDAGAARGD
jgi:hypothetical protein